jgi:hypothetical protein
MSAVLVASPHMTHSIVHANKVEEENESQPQHHWNPVSEAQCVVVASHMALSHDVIELLEETDLATWLIMVINVTLTDRNGDGLYERPEDSLCPFTEEEREVFAMSSQEWGPVITKEILAKHWGIGLDMAHQTLMAMMQSGIQCVLHPVECHYKTHQSHLRFPTLNMHFYTDTMFSTAKSL